MISVIKFFDCVIRINQSSGIQGYSASDSTQPQTSVGPQKQMHHPTTAQAVRHMHAQSPTIESLVLLLCRLVATGKHGELFDL